MDSSSKPSVIASIFDKPLSAGYGKRLGVPFTRAQQEEISVCFHTSDASHEDDLVLNLEQSGMGKYSMFSPW